MAQVKGCRHSAQDWYRDEEGFLRCLECEAGELALFRARCRMVPGPEFVRTLERLWGPGWGDVRTEEDAQRAMQAAGYAPPLVVRSQADADRVSAAYAAAQGAAKRRYLIADPSELEVTVPQIATLPDGSTIALPAGTMLREATSEEGAKSAHDADLRRRHAAWKDRQLAEVFEALGKPKDLPLDGLPSRVRQTVEMLAQARGLLQRARSTMRSFVGPSLLEEVRAEIDAFLAGLPVTGEDAEDVRRAKAARAETGERMPLERYRPPSLDDGPAKTCGAPCPEWLAARGRPCERPKGHGGDRDDPHHASIPGAAGVDVILGSSWINDAPQH